VSFTQQRLYSTVLSTIGRPITTSQGWYHHIVEPCSLSTVHTYVHTYKRTYIHTFIHTYIRTVHMIRSIIPYFLNTYHDDLTKRTSQHHHRRRSHHHHHPSLRRTMSDRLVARMGGSVIKYTRFHVCESERHSFVPTSQLNVASAQMGGGMPSILDCVLVRPAGRARTENKSMMNKGQSHPGSAVVHACLR